MNPDFGIHLIRWFLGLSLIPHAIHLMFAFCILGWVLASQLYVILLLVTASAALASAMYEDKGR